MDFPEVHPPAVADGGKLILAPDASWQKIVDGDDKTGYKVGINEAVFGFKDDRSATFYTCWSETNRQPAASSPIGKFSTRDVHIIQLREDRLLAHLLVIRLNRKNIRMALNDKVL